MRLPTRASLRSILISVVAITTMLVGASTAQAADTTRASLVWDQAVDIDFHIYDTNGEHAWYRDKTAIPDAVLTHDNISGFPTDAQPESFVDSRDPSTRTFIYRACYFSSHLATTPSVHVTLTVNDPNGRTREVTGTLTHVNECIDLAKSPANATVPPVASVTASTGSVNVDSRTGQIAIWMPLGHESDITIRRRFKCADGSTPTGVQFLMTAAASPTVAIGATLEDADTMTWVGTFSRFSLLNNSTITITGTCGATTESLPVGTLTLIDPSGFITNSKTGAAIKKAKVTLYRLPSPWTPRANAADTGANKCDSPESRVGSAPWDQTVPSGGFVTSPLDPTAVISPAANPVLTNSTGHYAWDVTGGYCWYVKATKDGFGTTKSGLVGVNVGGAPVLDLNLKLTPLTTTKLKMTARRTASRKVIAKGALTPKACGKRAKVRIERKAGSGWKLIATVKATAKGKFLSRPLKVKGSHVKIRAHFNETTTCAASSSRTRSV